MANGKLKPQVQTLEEFNYEGILPKEHNLDGILPKKFNFDGIDKKVPKVPTQIQTASGIPRTASLPEFDVPTVPSVRVAEEPEEIVQMPFLGPEFFAEAEQATAPVFREAPELEAQRIAGDPRTGKRAKFVLGKAVDTLLPGVFDDLPHKQISELARKELPGALKAGQIGTQVSGELLRLMLVNKFVGPIVDKFWVTGKGASLIVKLPNIGKFAVRQASRTGSVFGALETTRQLPEVARGKPLTEAAKEIAVTTATGAALGSTALLPSVIGQIMADAAIGFVATKRRGGNDLDAAMNAAIFGLFKAVNAKGIQKQIRNAYFQDAKEAMAKEFIDQGLTADQASRVSERFMGVFTNKAGGIDAVKPKSAKAFRDWVVNKWEFNLRKAGIPSRPTPTGGQPPAPVGGVPATQRTVNERAEAIADQLTKLERTRQGPRGREGLRRDLAIEELTTLPEERALPAGQERKQLTGRTLRTLLAEVPENERIPVLEQLFALERQPQPVQPQQRQIGTSPTLDPERLERISAIEQELTRQERIRQSPEGKRLLKEQLAAEEKPVVTGKPTVRRVPRQPVTGKDLAEAGVGAQVEIGGIKHTVISEKPGEVKIRDGGRAKTLKPTDKVEVDQGEVTPSDLTDKPISKEIQDLVKEENLEFLGVQESGEADIPNILFFNELDASKGTTFAVNEGASIQDIKKKLGETRARFIKAEPKVLGAKKVEKQAGEVVTVLGGRKKGVIDPRDNPVPSDVDRLIKEGMDEITVRVHGKASQAEPAIDRLKELGWRQWKRDRAVWLSPERSKKIDTVTPKPTVTKAPKAKPTVTKVKKAELGQFNINDRVRFVGSGKQAATIEGEISETVKSTTGTRGFKIIQDNGDIARLFENQGTFTLIKKGSEGKPAFPAEEVAEVKRKQTAERERKFDSLEIGDRIKFTGSGKDARVIEGVMTHTLKRGDGRKGLFVRQEDGGDVRVFEDEGTFTLIQKKDDVKAVKDKQKAEAGRDIRGEFIFTTNMKKRGELLERGERDVVISDLGELPVFEGKLPKVKKDVDVTALLLKNNTRTEEHRVALTGVFNDKDRIVATDGHQLVSVIGKGQKNGKIIGPDGEIEGDYPDYKRVIPAKKDTNKLGKFNIEDGFRITKKAHKLRVGESAGFVKIADRFYNPLALKKVMDSLQALGVERVVLRHKKKSGALVMEAEGIQALVMPVARGELKTFNWEWKPAGKATVRKVKAISKPRPKKAKIVPTEEAVSEIVEGRKESTIGTKEFKKRMTTELDKAIAKAKDFTPEEQRILDISKELKKKLTNKQRRILTTKLKGLTGKSVSEAFSDRQRLRELKEIRNDVLKKHGTVSIHIPGDGDFTIANVKAVLEATKKRVGRLTLAGEKPSVKKVPKKKPTVTKAVKAKPTVRKVPVSTVKTVPKPKKISELPINQIKLDDLKVDDRYIDAKTGEVFWVTGKNPDGTISVQDGKKKKLSGMKVREIRGEINGPETTFAGGQLHEPGRRFVVGETGETRVFKGYGKIESGQPQPGKFKASKSPQEVADTGELKGVPLAMDQLLKVVAPARRSDITKETARILRTRLAQLAQKQVAAKVQFRKAHRAFNFIPQEFSLDFMDRMEHGKQQKEKKFKAIADQAREILVQRRKQVQALGKGHLEKFYENYFPHIWKDPKRAEGVIAGILGKRPLAGSKSFLKKRSIVTVKDGVDAGLEPVSWNPIDQVLYKVHEMDRFIMAHNLVQDLKGRGLIKFKYARTKMPPNFKKLNDSIFTVYMPLYLTVDEAFDKILVEDLMAFAESMGINAKRLMKLKARSWWGYAQGDTQVRTKFAGPENVLVHEIGHIIGNRYNFFDWMTTPPGKKFKTGKRAGQEIKADARRERVKIKNQLRDLADARFEQMEPTNYFRRYVRKAEEKEAVMLEAYIHAPEMMKKVAPDVFDRFKKFLNSRSELRPLLDIQTSVVLGGGQGRLDVPGITKLGDYIASENVATLINNHLSGGLRSADNVLVSGAYDLLRKAANTLNFANLSLSMFHGLNTTTDVMATTLGLGLRKIFATEGQTISGLKDVASTPVSPFVNLWRGNKIKKLMEQDLLKMTDPKHQDIVKNVILAGGRSQMDMFYHNQAAKSLIRSINQVINGTVKEKFKGIAKFPVNTLMAAIELTSKPIMQWLVPRQKLGAFYMLARHEIARAKAGQINDEQFHERLSQSWDNVDNRMGQLVYDNLFWNKTMKDALMMGIRSVGWNLGSWREFGGAPIDFLNTPKRIKEGDVWMSQKMGYTIGAAIVYSVLGAVLMYLMTGKGPTELKDYFFPKTGKKNADGSDERLSLPTYAKDWFAYATRPLVTLSHKMHPIWSTLSDIARNEDFYGTEIRHKDDPTMKQLIDSAEFFGESFLPFSVKNYIRMTKQGREPLTAAVVSVTGIQSAPSYVTRSHAQKLATEYIIARLPRETRTKEQFTRSDRRKQLKMLARVGKDIDGHPLAEGFTDKEMRRIKRDASKEPFAESFNRLTLEKALNVYAVATEEEKGQVRDLLISKFKRSPKNTNPEIQKLYRELGFRIQPTVTKRKKRKARVTKRKRR